MNNDLYMQKEKMLSLAVQLLANRNDTPTPGTVTHYAECFLDWLGVTDEKEKGK